MNAFFFTVRTTRSESDFSSRDTKKRMDTFKPAEPRWDARLVLPQPTWPPKSASYTVSGILPSCYFYYHSIMLSEMLILMSRCTGVGTEKNNQTELEIIDPYLAK